MLVFKPMSLSEHSSKPIPVLLDCDTGIDDALAVIYLAALHRAGEIELKAVTTTAGNVDVAQTATNTAYILNLCGVQGVPVVAGEPQPVKLPLVTTPETHGPHGLGYVQPPLELRDCVDPRSWQDVWEEALLADPRTRLIVTGPATNLAVYLKDHDTPENVTLMGGAYQYPGNTTATAEWNTWVDPHAAKEVFTADLNITVCALQVTEGFTINPEKLSKYQEILTSTGSTRARGVAEILEPMLRFYFEFHQSVGEGYLAQIHDLLTCMIALGRVNYSAIDVAIDVEAGSDLMRGTTVADYKNHWQRPQTAHLVTDVDYAQAHLEFEKTLTLLAL